MTQMDEQIIKEFAAALAKAMQVPGTPQKPRSEVGIVREALEMAGLEIVRKAPP